MTRPAHTAPTSLDELIARLEAATVGTDDLDQEIAETVLGWKQYALAWGSGWHDAKGMSHGWHDIPKSTRSLDAAMGLVPEGWDWCLYSDGGGEIYKDVPSGMLPGAPGSTVISFEGATPALALCIAALRARVQP